MNAKKYRHEHEEVSSMKVERPLYSKSAHGDLAGLIRYQRRGNINYVKRINKLPTTASAAQLAHRAEYKQIWEDWLGLPPLVKAVWAVLAKQFGFYSGRHCYLFWRLGWRP